MAVHHGLASGQVFAVQITHLGQILVEEQQGTFGLILGGGRHIPLGGQIAQKPLHIRRQKLARVALVMNLMYRLIHQAVNPAVQSNHVYPLR